MDFAVTALRSTKCLVNAAQPICMAIQMILSAIPSLFYNYYAKLITKTYHPRYRPWYHYHGFWHHPAKYSQAFANNMNH